MALIKYIHFKTGNQKSWLFLMFFILSFLFILAGFSMGDQETHKELPGSYLFIEESSGYKPAVGAEIILRFILPDRLIIIATMPGKESVSDSGNFEQINGRISLELPGLGKKVEEGSFSFDGKKLVLPFLVIDEGEGTSTWEKIETEEGSLEQSIEIFLDALSRGTARGTAIQNLKTDLQQSPDIKSVELNSERSLKITYSSGYEEYFLAVQDFSGIPSSQPGGPSPPLSLVSYSMTPIQFFLNRPQTNRTSWYRTYLQYEPEPISKGDAPNYKNAVIFSAFHTIALPVPGGQGLKYMNFRDKGENLSVIEEALKKASYQVAPLIIDGSVTVEKIWEIFNKSWGVVYFSTHGVCLNNGDYLISTGEQIPAQHRKTASSRASYLNSLLKSLGKKAALPSSLHPFFKIEYINDAPFIVIHSDFFNNVKGDFSGSLVYINACESAKSTNLRIAINARAFAGWKQEIDMEMGGDFLKPFWGCLSLKTRSAREAMDYTKNYLLEIKEYSKKLAVYGSSFDPNAFALWRKGASRETANLTQAQRRMLTAVREYAWLKKNSTGKEELRQIVEELYNCQPKDIRGLGGKPFCRKAFVGRIPPLKEIDEAKGELCGYGGSPARFTLIEK